MFMLKVLLSFVLVVTVVIAWRLIAGREAFNNVAFATVHGIKRGLKPVMIFGIIAALAVVVGTSFQESAKTANLNAVQTAQIDRAQKLQEQLKVLNDEQADKYDVCWRNDSSAFFPVSSEHLESKELNRMSRCLSTAVNLDLVVMQDWYKKHNTDMEECRNLIPTFSFPDYSSSSVSRPSPPPEPPASCDITYLEAAKANRWPVDFFECGYKKDLYPNDPKIRNFYRVNRGRLGNTTHCGSEVSPSDGVVASTAVLDRADYLFLYEQEWAKPLLSCYSRSHYMQGETKPSGRSTAGKWTQREEPCEFSFDLLQDAAKAAGWPISTGFKARPLSYYKPATTTVHSEP